MEIDGIILIAKNLTFELERRKALGKNEDKALMLELKIARNALTSLYNELKQRKIHSIGVVYGISK